MKPHARAPLLIALCAVMVFAACAGPTPAPTSTLTATAVPLGTRLLAEMRGVVSLADGCLEAGDHVLVWPPEFTVTVDGDRVEVTDGYTGETAVWREGDTVDLAGGAISRTRIDAEAGQRWVGACEDANSYFLVGFINAAIPATATLPALGATGK